MSYLGTTHFLSVLLMAFLVRSGLEILASCPKLWWRDDCKTGDEWLRLTRKKLPEGRLWTTLEEEADWSPWISLPGHKNLGLGRLWHFLAAGLWIVNGLVYYFFLFWTGGWRRLIPTSWDVFPGALRTANTYLHFQLPAHGEPYNPLQQLAYAAAAFLFPAFMIATGLAMSPGIEARFPWYVKLWRNRQTARSLHFLGLVGILGFTVVHVFLVLIEGFTGNLNYLFFETRTADSRLSLALLAAWMTLVIGAQVAATWATLRSRRKAQRALTAFVTPIRRRLFGNLLSRQEWPEESISPELRVNGYPPDTEEYFELAATDFRDYRLRVTGLVARPLELSLADLRALPRKSQTTLHNCIQGWTGIAKWTGVPVSALLDLARPLEGAEFVVFYSFQWFMGRPFYETLKLKHMRDPQTILAYEMNGRSLPVEHGAPLRLRVENQLGYKMVKFIAEIELVPSYELIGLGMGGHREDHRFYGTDAGI